MMRNLRNILTLRTAAISLLMLAPLMTPGGH